MLLKSLLVIVPLFTWTLNEGSFIEWSDERKLVWSDFTGKPDPASTNAALTNSSIHLEFGYNEKSFTYAIKCRFNKHLSWVRIKNDYILNHEQGHFDIAEAHARILHKQLLDYQFNGKTVAKDVNNIYEEVMKEHVSTQQAYDKETNHSLDRDAQAAWDKKINSLLSDNKRYRNYGKQ